MPTVLPMTRVEAYLAYKAGVIAESDLKPSLKTNYYSGLEHWLAYWCGLCNDYPTKDGQPKWYTEEEYYIAYLCGIAPDYPTNCYRRVGAYLRHIISYRWPEPDKPLTREEYYLSLMQSTVVVNPTPSSDIYLSPTTEGPIKLLGVYGNTTQETLTGKNKTGYNYASIKSANTGSGRVFDDNAKTMTYNGITYKINDDGTILVTGTSEGNSFLVLENPVSGLVSGTDYIVNGCPSGGSASTYSLRLYTESTTYIWDGGSGTSPFTYDTTQDIFRINMSGGTAAPTGGLLFKPMIRLATETDATYEPYCGGLPAPNPTFPEPVNVVTGGQTVQIFTTNKFKTSAVVNLACGSTILTSDTYRGWYCPVTAGETYLVSRTSTSAPGRFRSCFTQAKPVGGVRCYNEAGVNGYDTHDSDTMFKVTVPAGMTYLFLYLSNSDETITEDMGISVKNAQKFDINLGKNLWGGLPSSVPRTVGNLVFSNNADGSVSVEAGTSGSTVANSLNSTAAVSENHYIHLTAGTYTLSGGDGTISVQLVNLTGTQLLTTTSSASITLENDTDAFIRIQVPATTTTSAKTIYPQIELGSVATSYAPYFTPIELCEIGNYQDAIFKNTPDSELYDSSLTEGAWYKRAEIGKVVYDETDVVGYANGVSYCDTTLVGDSTSNTIAVSDYFTFGGRSSNTTNAYNKGDAKFSIATSGLRFYFRNDSLTSQANWETWLSTHNTTVYYVLATATNTQITNADLIAQLEAIGHVYAADGFTALTVVTPEPNLPALLVVSAPKYQ